MAEPLSPSVPETLWAALAVDREAQAYPAGAQLFNSGEACRGVYLIAEGCVDLHLSGSNQAEDSLERVGSGSMLGLSEALCGGVHKLTACTKTEAQVIFVGRTELLRVLRRDPNLCMQLVRLLSEDLHVLYRKCQEQPRAVKSAAAPSRVAIPPRNSQDLI